jgi:hypothetical protein
MNTRRSRIHLLTLALVLSMTVAPVWAEVGVSTKNYDGSARVTALYILRIIVDDPDPASRYWIRQTSQGPSKRILNDQGFDNGDGKPSTLLHPTTDKAIVVWSKNSPDGYDIAFSYFNDAGVWSVPEIIASSLSDETDPHVFHDPSDGSVHVVYWVQDPTPRVMHLLAPADLSNWSTPVEVSSIGDVAVRPTGVFHDGKLRIVYENHFNGLGAIPREIVVATDEPGGFVKETITLTSHLEPNRPEIHTAGGKLWLDWVDADDQMAWTRSQPSGGWDSIRLESFGDYTERELFVRGRIRWGALAP